MSSRIKTDVKKLFEFWCEVVPTYSADRSICKYNIVESFPDSFRDAKTIADIPAFAFPCEMEGQSVKPYSFLLTTDDSKWRFGFCRYDANTDSAMVIITYLPWHDTFLRLLPLLGELRRNNPNEFKSFLTEAYNSGVPDYGSKVELIFTGKNGKNEFIFERPAQFQLPNILENHNLNMYYNFVEPKNMIAVFAAMLAERRIIFTSKCLDRLSSCIQAAHAFLYPMVWQHILIPVLPLKLKDFLCAPMPYLIGVPQSVLETMMPEELGDVVIMNCDTKIFESPFDDVHEMPSEIVSQLKKQLSRPTELVGDRISKIFLGVLVQLIGGYRDAVEYRDTGKTFNREKFIESRPSHLRPFLTKMMELQIFQQFIDERLDMLHTGLGLSDEFEMETVRYAEKKKRRNLAFLKNVKDKTNPAVKSAVKSVKEGSRGMKTAYKDLKTKLRDITPPNGQFRSHVPSNSQHEHIVDGCSSSSNYSLGSKPTGAKHHSAPSSPVFSSKLQNNNNNQNSSVVRAKQPFQYAKPEVINGAVQSFRRAPNPLAMSSSTSHIQPNGHTQASYLNNHHNNPFSSSPTVSPASSLCSSEMNLSQELQNHPLFKTPIVDRSSLRSLQPHYLQVTTTNANNKTSTMGSLNSVPSSSSHEEDNTNDLISLDDSHNNSFDIEDFDPLNQNARPLPQIGGNKKSTTLPNGSTLMTPQNQQSASMIIRNQPFGAGTNTLAPSGISNPLYPFFQPPNCQPPPLPKTKPPPLPITDDDFELLRKYDLHQFALTTSVTSTTTAAAATANGMSNWTTFD